MLADEPVGIRKAINVNATTGSAIDSTLTAFWVRSPTGQLSGGHWHGFRKSGTASLWTPWEWAARDCPKIVAMASKETTKNFILRVEGTG